MLIDFYHVISPFFFVNSSSLPATQGGQRRGWREGRDPFTWLWRGCGVASLASWRIYQNGGVIFWNIICKWRKIYAGENLRKTLDESRSLFSKILQFIVGWWGKVGYTSHSMVTCFDSQKWPKSVHRNGLVLVRLMTRKLWLGRWSQKKRPFFGG